MQNALQLFGFLLLTMIGLLLPLLTVLFSFLPKGMEMLTGKYESERKQSEKSIEEEIKKRDSGAGLDYQSLGRTLRTLKQNKKRAETRLSFLNPTRLIIRIAVPLAISLVAIIVALQNVPTPVLLLAVVVSITAFSYAIRVLWISFQVLSEVARVVNESRESFESKLIELLSALVEKSGAEVLFLKPAKISVKFLDKFLLKENESFTFSANKKHDIPVSITNIDDLMAKNVELGFVFPPDFLVERTPNIASIYSAASEQIVRFKVAFIQADTNHILGGMNITFLKAGNFKASAFIKGENIRNKETSFSIKVID